MKPERTLIEFIEFWMVNFKMNAIKQSSYDRLITSMNALRKYKIAQKPFDKVTFFDIQDYVNELVLYGYSLTTIRKQLRIVTAPLKQAAAMRLIPTDPTVGVRLPARSNVRKKDRKMTAYSEEEQGRLFMYMERTQRTGPWCVGFMIETGLRVGEALALQWSDVDLAHSKLHVHSTVVRLANKKQSFVQDSPKSYSSERTIPLTPKAKEILRRMKLGNKSSWVFQNHGDRLSYESLRYQTKRLCENAKVPYCGEHVFRHTFATNCYYKGIDVKILSRLLGHSDVSVTYNTYINLYGDGFDDMYNALVGSNQNGR